MKTDHPWCRITTVASDGTVTGTWVLDGVDRPDLAAIDSIARYALVASRRDERMLLHDVCSELTDLLRLVGLPVQLYEGDSS
jgi:hypothetical protein